MIFIGIVVTLMTHGVTVESMFSVPNGFRGTSNPFEDPLFWEYYFLFTESGPYAKAKDMAIPGFGNAFRSQHKAPTTYRGPISHNFRRRDKDKLNQFGKDLKQNNIITSGSNLNGKRRNYIETNQKEDIIKNKMGYRVPDLPEMGTSRPSSSRNVSPFVHTSGNQAANENSFTKLINTLTLKSGNGGKTRSTFPLFSVAGNEVESRQDLTKRFPGSAEGIQNRSTTAINAVIKSGPLSPPVVSDFKERRPDFVAPVLTSGTRISTLKLPFIEGRDSSTVIDRSNAGLSKAFHPQKANDVSLMSQNPSSYLTEGNDALQTDLVKTFISSRTNEGSTTGTQEFQNSLIKSLLSSKTNQGQQEPQSVLSQKLQDIFVGNDASQTRLPETLIPFGDNNKVSLTQSILSQISRPRPAAQNSEMLKTLILSGSLQITDPLTLHYLLKDSNSKGSSANIIPLLALAGGGGETTNPLLLNHILSSILTQSTANKTNQKSNDINDFLIPLLLSSGVGGENMNHLLLQTVLSQMHPYQSSQNVLQTLSMTSGEESPLMQNPSFFNHLIQSNKQQKGGYSIQNILPLIIGNEEMAENTGLMMRMLRQPSFTPY